jgi:hypothetical protein
MLKRSSTLMQTDKAANKILELLETLAESNDGVGLHFLAGQINLPESPLVS